MYWAWSILCYREKTHLLAVVPHGCSVVGKGKQGGSFLFWVAPRWWVGEGKNIPKEQTEKGRRQNSEHQGEMDSTGKLGGWLTDVR